MNANLLIQWEAEVGALQKLLTEKDAEIERFKGFLGCASDALSYETQKVRAEIARLKPLLARAADALEYWNDLPDSRAKFLTLIDELRKAAE